MLSLLYLYTTLRNPCLPSPGWAQKYQSQQLTWTISPQGFRDSPHFFSQGLQRDLQTYNLGSTTLLQYVDNLLLCSSSRHNCLLHSSRIWTCIKCPKHLGLQSLTLQGTSCFHHCQLQGVASHSHIQNYFSSDTLRRVTYPQAQNQEGISFSIKSIKLLLNMGPKFCPPHKTSLPSYSRKLRWALTGPHLSPHSNTDSYQTFNRGPFSLFTWLHQDFFPFCTFSTRNALGILWQKRGDIWGPLAYLSKPLDHVMLG